MTTELIAEFVDSMTNADNLVRLYGKLYWCLGCYTDFATGKTTIQVYEAEPGSYSAVREMLVCCTRSIDECMKHFLEDKYWDGKSFYEVASDMEWVNG